MLTIGVAAGTQAPKVFDVFSKDDAIDAVDGDVRAPTDETMDEQQNRAINEIIEKLKKQDDAIADAKKFGRGDDHAQNERLEALETLVQ